MRLDEHLITLSALSMEDRDMVQRAAARDLEARDWEMTRAKVVNRRHVVSQEFPVPDEVNT